jgi:son of sevenless
MLATEEGDVWSFGMLCLEVFTGEDPYSSRPDLYVPVLLSQGETPEHPGPNAAGLTPNMWEVMQSCWKIEPPERPSMNTILSRIRGLRPRRTTLADGE